MSNITTTTNAWGSGGYHCSCGAWVPTGTAHACISPKTWPTTTYPTMTTYPVYWPTSDPEPTVRRFCGAVHTFDRLPAQADTGDTYYVEEMRALAISVRSGWYFPPTKR